MAMAPNMRWKCSRNPGTVESDLSGITVPSDNGQSANASPDPVLVVIAPHRMVTVVTTTIAIARKNGPRVAVGRAAGSLAGELMQGVRECPARC